MNSNFILVIILEMLVGVLTFLIGFGTGFGFRLLFGIMADLRSALAKKQDKVESDPESGIADSSPEHLKEKAAERERHGEPVVDKEESQIINTRTSGEQQASVDKAKNAKLDKWMPDVKHGK